MSKAFTKESDGEDDDNLDDEELPVIPKGSKNYITPAGCKRLQDELRELKTKTRPEVTAVVSWAASNGDRSENADYHYGKKKLREIDKRIRFIAKRLDNVEIVDPLKVKSDTVLFGATVTVRDEDGTLKTYSIVGADETDVDKGRISWLSPLAQALFKARVDDYVSFRTPKGIRDLEVIEIKYIELP